MTPRVTLLIAVSLVVYVSLSLYHWRQEKKMPGTENRKGVHSVLARDSQEKNWVQVSTSPNPSGQSIKNNVPVEPPVIKAQQTGEQKAAPLADSQAETSLSAENTTADSVRQGQRTAYDENNKPQKALQDEKKINQLQTEKVEELPAQTPSGLQGKNILLEELKDKPAVLNAKPNETTPSRDNQVKVLQSSLASRLDALTKANDRITALAERLDKSNRTLVETKNINSHLQRVLSETETARIKAHQEADSLVDELIQTKEDKEKYLAETGRLHKQLQQKKTRLARIENELNKSHLKAEAMLRYGQEQTDLVTPFIQQIKILNAQIEDKKGELIEVEDQIGQFRDQEQELQDKIQALELDFLEKKEVISQKLMEKSQSLENAQQHSDELTLQLKVLADQINAKNVIINKLNQDLTLAQTNAQDAAARHAEILNEETGRQQDELVSARQALADMKQQLDEVTARQNETETKLNEANTENKQLAVKFAEQQAAVRSESESITAQLTQKDMQLAEATEALHSARTTLQELETAQETMAVTNTAEADETIQKLKESLANAERKQTDETETATLQQKIDQLNKTIADHDKQQKTMEQKLSDIKEENKQLQERINTVEQENRNAIEVSSTLEQKTSEFNEEKARAGILESKAADLQSDLDRRESTFFTLQEEYTSLQNKHDSLLKEQDTLLLYTLDSDNDTISDAKDTCPGTVSGAEVGQDGCEPDQDGDTIVNRLDLCPDTLEQSDINSFGCSEGAHIVLSGIYFSGGDTDLSPSSRSYLDKVAAVLDLSRVLRFEVAGHTDNIGETGRNLTVSKMRAEAVSNYLVESGVEAGRLVAVGHGSDQPVADNSTSEGRAANRRVELRIISPNASPAVVEEKKSTATAEEEGLPGQ